MVVSRSDVKKRKKDSCDVSTIQHSPKRTKVHAQRKFAQGSNLNSPHLTPVKDKDKVKVNGNVTPTELLPAKRPNTEDFLTFLCFRGTSILPPRLDFFNVASAPETQEEEVRNTDNKNAGPVAGSSRVNTRSLDKSSSDQVTGVVKADARTRSKPKSTSAVLAFKKKYHEQRLAKQKTSLTKLAQKVKGKNMVRTRSAALLEESRPNKRPLKSHGVVVRAVRPKVPQKILPRRHHAPVKRLVTKHLSLRAGLRSSGNLPPGSDIGIRSDRKPRKVMKVQAVVQKSVSKAPGGKTAKVQVKQANSISDFSSDDDQPLVKKQRTRSSEKVVVETITTRSRQNMLANKDKDKTSISSRPTRKTKEAATLFMEMLGKDLRSADDEFDDEDDNFSVESFPELPNSRKIEQQEKEIRTLAEKNAALQKEKRETQKKESKKVLPKKEKHKEENPVLKRNKVSVDRKLIKRSVVKLNAIKSKDLKKTVPTTSVKEKIPVKDKVAVKEKILAKEKLPVKEKSPTKEKLPLKDVSVEGTSKKPKNITKSVATDKKQLPETRKREDLKNSARTNAVNTRSVKASPGRSVRLKKIHSNLSNEYFSDSDEEPLKNVSNSSTCSVKGIKKKSPIKKNTVLGIKKERSNEREKKQNSSMELHDKEHQVLEKKDTTRKVNKVLIKRKTLKKLPPNKNCNLADVNSLTVEKTKSSKNKRSETSASQKSKAIKKSDSKDKTNVKDTKTNSEQKAVVHKSNIKKKGNIVNKNYKVISPSKTSKTVKECKNTKDSEESLFSEYESSHESLVDLSEDEPLANVLQRSMLERNKGNKKSCASKDIKSEVEHSLIKQEIVNDIKNTASVAMVNENVKQDIPDKEVTPTLEKNSESENIHEAVVKQNSNRCNLEDKRPKYPANKNLPHSLVPEECKNNEVFSSEKSSIYSASEKHKTNDLPMKKVSSVNLVSEKQKANEFSASEKPLASLIPEKQKVHVFSADEKSSASSVPEIQEVDKFPVKDKLSESIISGKLKPHEFSPHGRVSVNLVPENRRLCECPTDERFSVGFVPEKCETHEFSGNEKSQVMQEYLLKTNNSEDYSHNINEEVLVSTKVNKEYPNMNDNKEIIKLESDLQTKLQKMHPASISVVEHTSVDPKNNYVFENFKFIDNENLSKERIERSVALTFPECDAASSLAMICLNEDLRITKCGIEEKYKAENILENKEHLHSVAESDGNLNICHVDPVRADSIPELVKSIPVPGKSDVMKTEAVTNCSVLTDMESNNDTCCSSNKIEGKHVMVNVPSLHPKNSEKLLQSNSCRVTDVPVCSNPKLSQETDCRRDLNIVTEKEKSDIMPPIKVKPSVNETWRQAFKNVKIPKPVQPSTSSSTDKGPPRKPLSVTALAKKHSQLKSDAEKTEKTTTAQPAIPFVRQSKLFLGTGNIVTKMTEKEEDEPVTGKQKSSVIDMKELREKEAEVEQIVRQYVAGELSKSSQFTSSSPVSETINFNSEVRRTASPVLTGFPQREEPSTKPFRGPVLPIKDNLVQPPVTKIPSKLEEQNTRNVLLTNPSEAKHHHLPLPVEQTLRKLSQTKPNINKKAYIIPNSSKQQEQYKTVSSHSTEFQSVPASSLVSQPVKTNDTEVTKKMHNPVLPVTKSTPKCQTNNAVDFNINKGEHIDLMSKKKVNMSKEEINKWLSDSTSSGIEHTQNCGIFEKNECECRYKTSTPNCNKVERTPMDVNKSVDKIVEPTHKSLYSHSGVNVVACTSLTVTAQTIQENVKQSHPENKNDVTGNAVEESLDKNRLNVVDRQNVISKVDLKKPVILDTVVNTTGEPVKQNSQNSNLASDTVLPGASKTQNEERHGTDSTGNLYTFGTMSDVKGKVSKSAYKFGDSEAEISSRDASDISSSNEDSPDKSTHPERRSIFHQRRLSVKIRERTQLTPRSSNAFSPENESSVYAFDPYLPPTNSAPFRRSKGKEEKSLNTAADEEESSPNSASIAVQVNLDSEAVLECSTQTDTQEGEYDDSEGHLFYIPLQQSAADTAVSQQVIQGVAVKLGTEGPDQRVIMRAQLVTKPAANFSRPPTSAGSAVVTNQTLRAGTISKPEQKVRPLSVKPPVGTVQPTARSLNCSLSNQPDVSIQTSPQHSENAENAVDEKTGVPGPSNLSPVTEPELVKVKAPERVLPSTSTAPRSAKRKSKNQLPTSGTCLEFPTVDGRARLVEAPTFYPTDKEFQDPLEYIDSIRSVAEKFGLCRVVPPTDFKPECKVADEMRFTAYNQYVHKMLYRWGPNVKELMAIKKYLATQSIALKNLPLIGGMEVDLPRLYQTVQSCGGLKEVIEKKRWQKVADAMKIPKSAQDRVTKLDDVYCKYLLPYDTLSHEERTKLFEEVEKEWKEREKRVSLSENDNDADEEEDNELEEDEEDDGCGGGSCSDEADSDELDECIVKGRTMPLHQFYRVARNTMSMWFSKTENPSAAEVESEFWRHVAARQNHVCVLTGSIDCSTGYGFPVGKNSSTSRHPWNLKVLSNNAGSILRSMGHLMGLTVPTLHVGMLFSTCCWYRDPHGLPWIEYLHTGASKIWYGIPDSSSSVFREAVMGLVPRLVRDKKIWLASDTAMVPPPQLVERGVSLCRVVQEPGQFILVFPKAFTSSICAGYLVSESVYFAQPSWLATAEQIFDDIRESCEPCMFSLEKLLFSIATDSRSHVDVLNQILPMIVAIQKKELHGRRQLEEVGLKASERLPIHKRKKKPTNNSDADYECEICRANLFISHVADSLDKSVYCLPHAVELFKKNTNQLKHCSLFYTYDEEELGELIEKLKARIESKYQKKGQNKPAPATSSIV